jgi:CrcB protein
MRNYLLIGLGGFVGANVRYWLGMAINGLTSGAAFPLSTLFINLTGSLIIGFVLGLYERFTLSSQLRLTFVTGFLGAYTTFSSFSYEVVNLARHDEILLALLYVLASLTLGVLAVWFGFTLSKMVRRTT